MEKYIHTYIREVWSQILSSYCQPYARNGCWKCAIRHAHDTQHWVSAGIGRAPVHADPQCQPQASPEAGDELRAVERFVGGGEGVPGQGEDGRKVVGEHGRRRKQEITHTLWRRWELCSPRPQRYF